MFCDIHKISVHIRKLMTRLIGVLALQNKAYYSLLEAGKLWKKVWKKVWKNAPVALAVHFFHNFFSIVPRNLWKFCIYFSMFYLHQRWYTLNSKHKMLLISSQIKLSSFKMAVHLTLFVVCYVLCSLLLSVVLHHKSNQMPN